MMVVFDVRGGTMLGGLTSRHDVGRNCCVSNLGGGEDREEEVDDGVSAWASRMTTSDVGTSTISIISLADF